ncbi:TVP38/TMEM64 family protein [Natrialbaceae archaeon A-arb3/5]
MPPVSTRVLVGVIVGTAIVTAGLLLSPATVIGSIESLAADPMLFGLVVAGLYLVRPLLAWPTTPLAIVVGYGYGVAVGIPLALVGVVVTVIPTFVAARWFTAGSEQIAGVSDETDETTLDRASAAVSRYYRTAGPIRGVAASRLAPIPSDVSTCAAAASGVRLREFLVGTVLGELPWTIAAVVVGASAATITTDGIGELGVALTLICGAAAAALLAGPVYRYFQTRSQTNGSGRIAEN